MHANHRLIQVAEWGLTAVIGAAIAIVAMAAGLSLSTVTSDDTR